MALRILLASGTDWPFPARLAHAFTALGARVEAVCLKASPLRRSAAPARLHPFSGLRPLHALGRAIERATPDLFIPCDDLMAELMVRLATSRPQFAPLALRAFGNPDALPVLTSRNDFLREAAAAGAPAADNLALTQDGDLDRALAAFGLPLVIKADGSWGGGGVAIASDRDAARAALQRFSHPSRLKIALQALKRGEPHLLVRAQGPLNPRPGAQRFVPGHPATSAIACWQGRLLATNHFDVAMASGSGTGPATVVARAQDDAMEDSARRITARFGLSGLYGLDYMRDADGRIFLLEINPRATPTSHLALGMGHDLAAALLSAAGQPTPDRPAVTQKRHIALFPQELHRDSQSPYLTGGYNDIPVGDPGLVAALARRDPALTSFSPAFSGLSSLDRAPDPLRR
jgi:hypothetical protein